MLKRILLFTIILLLSSHTASFADIRETQEWLKAHGQNYKIEELKSLKELHLRKTQVSNITPLKQLKSLEILNLSWTRVSDITRLFK